MRVRSRVLLIAVAALVVFSAVAVAQEAAGPVPVPSILDQTKNSPLGARHWNIFRFGALNNPADPEQSNCMTCHSAVKIVDDPKAVISDFMKAGQQFCIGEEEVNGEPVFKFDTAKADGKYVGNDFEGITCRVCHVMDNRGLALRRPDNTCTLCHGRVYSWQKGSGSHIEQDFSEGHGDGYWDPSVHYRLGMQCQDCHFMNSVDHDYEAAEPEAIVKDAFCYNCHKDAKELEGIIEETQAIVAAALKNIDERVKAAGAVKLTDAQKALVKQAKDRSTFITKDLSKGVHNPQFAGRLINEAFAALDKAEGKTIPTPKVDLGNLTVYSQAQSTELGVRHWDMLQRTTFNAADPSQDSCISCHSAVKLTTDPKAKVADFLYKGQKYCTGESGEPPVFTFAEATADGKYVKNHLEGITCNACHTYGKDGKIGLVRSAEMTCGVCHGRPINWTRGSAKHGALDFMKGVGSKEKGVPDMPSMKVGMGFACQDCHFMDSSKHDFQAATPEQIAASPKCNSCHASAAEMKETIEKIVKETKDGVAKLAPRLEKAKAWVAKNPSNKEAAELYTQANAGPSIIAGDLSNGVHNPEFAAYLLKRSADLLTQFEAKYK